MEAAFIYRRINRVLKEGYKVKKNFEWRDMVLGNEQVVDNA